MSELTVTDFPAFYQEVHGYEPFPWQTALLDRVVQEGWPELIDVPTGLGKTSVIDVAVFAAALGRAEARAGVARRIFLVVDRRLIVDEAYRHAEKIAEALRTPEDDSRAAEVATALRVDGDTADRPVEVTRMRGGVNWSWRWIERPDRHAIVVGTVDQVGSRFFFRGYGVGKHLRPIDAALAGTDSLIVVDEAHLSEAFLASVRRATACDETPAPIRPTVVSMSASPESGTADVHRITDVDENHREASRRLRAAKELHLVDVPTTKANTAKAMSGALAHWARELQREHPVVGVVVNTVARARAVFELLRTDSASRCVLLTGKIRPTDRDYLLAEHYERIRAGRDRTSAEPMFVVATQTIEVGANIDLDALVTESASLPALIQRLGRLNRLGDQRTVAPAVVLHGSADSDGVYDTARPATWAWLRERIPPLPHSPKVRLPAEPGMDASPSALRTLVRALPPGQWATLREPRPYVPSLSRAHLDVWTRTSPIPLNDIPLPPYLHGLNRGTPQVTVLWRDLPDDDTLWPDLVGLMPPTSTESIELPLRAVQRWLNGEAGGDDISDLEAEHLPDIPVPPGGRTVLRYRSRDNSEVIAADRIHPSDTIVVPASHGGCDRYGWHPGSREPTIDIADLAQSAVRRGATIRVGPTLVRALETYAPDLVSEVAAWVERLNADYRDNPSLGQVRSLRSALGDPVPGRDELPHLAVLRRLTGGSRARLIEHLDTGTLLLSSGTAAFREDSTAAGSSVSTGKLSLAVHQREVAEKAEEFARNLGMEPETIRAVGLAALWHDEGKRDPRFQVMLCGGDRWAAAANDEPLAKSGMNPGDRAAFRQARRRASYPADMRHEALSTQIATVLLTEVPDVDHDLVLHLIASHHGRSRPLLPPVIDPDPTTKIERNGQPIEVDTSQSVDWASPARFERLNRCYGRWGLARLEAVVRLADIWCSARSEERT
ncbi:type I-U CRISPR-associated helicase/endonuclease Cas3 [Streptosporangium sp. NBC_01755]|uniref:type I-G CRISPR-associated helicase/endonuclease Cas3g n=1 Tax=Streptosporangium sp. NBC_01755 TaxID=2975949 RepID=UPI002DD960AA|nr:type I-U CRISPR-associated helicase/endonuclease Cas3 [Streptosporangium sp. NBC_01755]WSC98179.1 type I-U CRISPR-associated helicase/endonuclease Cas3 [Streptosporangium sp. NBC_01755]